MGDAGTLSVAAQDALTGSGVQSVTGAKTFNDQKLVLRNPANTFSLTMRNPAITANSELILNLAYTFYVCKVSTTYYVKSGSLGGAVVHSGSNARTEIQWAIDNVPSDSGTGSAIYGGQIILAPNTLYDLGSTGTEGILITESKTKYINFFGSGVTSMIKWTGTGPAIRVNKSGTSSFHRWRMGNFSLLGENIAWDSGTTTRTSNRDGILVDQVFGNFELTHIWGRNFDNLITVDSTEFSDINNIVGKILNNGIVTTGSAATNTCSGINIHDFNFAGIWENGIWYNGNTPYSFEGCSIHDGVIDDFVQSAIRIDSFGTAVTIGPNIYTESIIAADEATYGGESQFHILLKGTSGAPMEDVTLFQVRMGGLENTDYAISEEYVKNLSINQCTAKGFRKALVLVNSNSGSNYLRIRLPSLRAYPNLTNVVTPYLIDVPSDSYLTGGDTRLVGTVETARATGMIITSASAGLVSGDVVKYSSAAASFVQTTTTADDLRPRVVMYGSAAANRPAVVAINGFMLVTVDAAIGFGDTITSSATTKKGRVNNNMIDPKLILGYSVGFLASAGQVWAQIK